MRHRPWERYKKVSTEIVNNKISHGNIEYWARRTREFLETNLYRHYRVIRMSKKAYRIIRDLFEVYGTNLHAPLWYRKRLLIECENLVGQPIGVCGEPGMECTGCISQADLNALGLVDDTITIGRQRKACACLSIKTELLDRRSPCKHDCLYCYWKG